jgi:hypothetical protein
MAKIGDSERTVKNHVVSLFRDPSVLTMPITATATRMKTVTSK